MIVAVVVAASGIRVQHAAAALLLLQMLLPHCCCCSCLRLLLLPVVVAAASAVVDATAIAIRLSTGRELSLRFSCNHTAAGGIRNETICLLSGRLNT